MNWFLNYFGKIWLVIFVFMVVGWVLNIIKFVCFGDFQFQVGMILVCVVGIFVFLVGLVFGYF